MSIVVRNGSHASDGPAGCAVIGVGACLAAYGLASPAAADTPADSATSRGPTEAESVVVTGVRRLLGDKIPLSVKDTPQSVNIIPLQVMQAQADTRLQDALRNVPGITLNAGEGAARGDTVDIRGFSAFNDFFLDGIRDAAVYDRDTFDLESVEVLKGPAATLFGRGSTGGAINQVSKAPTLDPLAQVIADVGTNDEFRATADIDEPIGDGAAARLNLMGETSKVADRDDVRNRRWGVAPAATVGIGGPTTLIASYIHLQEDNVPDVGVPFVFGSPSPVPRGADFGLESDRATSQVDVGTLVVRHEFSPTLSLTNTFRAANYAFSYVFAAPNFGDPPEGGQGAPLPGTPLSSVLVGRDSPSSMGDQTNVADQLDVTFRFETGPVRHTLVAGGELARQTNDLSRLANPFDANDDWVPETGLLDPDPLEAAPAEPVSGRQSTVAESEALYITDTMALGPSWDLIAGARLDRFAAAYRRNTVATGAQQNLSRVDVVGSPRVALVFKAKAWQSFYLSFGTSFDPSAEALTLTTSTANLGPVKATTYEAGSKTSLFGGGFLLTGAVFRTSVDNAQSDDPDNPTITVLDGRQTVEGLELGGSGHLTPRLRLDAGYTYLDGTTSGMGPSGPYNHTVAPNLPHNAFIAWGEYRVSPRWEIGFGANYLGKRYADVYNTARVPAYLVFDAMASYRLTPKVTLQLNALNLTDKLYYEGLYYTSAAENHVIPGPGRTIKLTVRAGI